MVWLLFNLTVAAAGFSHVQFAFCVYSCILNEFSMCC